MRLAAITCVVSVVCLSLSMRPVFQGDPETKPTLPIGSKAAIDALLEEMQGCWKLVSLESPNLEKQNRHDVGFMIVSGNYVSFELHIYWDSPEYKSDHRGFVSNTARFELDERLRLTSKSIIGSTINKDNLVLFEQPGLVRIYDVRCEGPKMRWRRDDETTYEFERVGDGKTNRDIYGRPIKAKDPNAPKEPPPQRRDNPPKKD